MKCGVWRVVYSAWSLECEVRSGKCEVWNLECEV